MPTRAGGWPAEWASRRPNCYTAEDVKTLLHELAGVTKRFVPQDAWLAYLEAVNERLEGPGRRKRTGGDLRLPVPVPERSGRKGFARRAGRPPTPRGMLELTCRYDAMRT